jgi:Mrr N-terminal domain
VPPSIPSSHAIDSALRRVVKRLRTLRKRINTSAAKEMKADDYEGAQKWMEMGRSVADYADRMEAFAEEWKRLVKATRIVARSHVGKEPGKPAATAKAKRTPMWKYCEPALKALAARGGAASLTELLEDLGRDFAQTLTDFDRATSSSRGFPRWHKAVKQAYHHCQREGWIERRKDGMWNITPKGAALAVLRAGQNDAHN